LKDHSRKETQDQNEFFPAAKAAVTSGRAQPWLRNSKPVPQCGNSLLYLAV